MKDTFSLVAAIYLACFVIGQVDSLFWPIEQTTSTVSNTDDPSDNKVPGGQKKDKHTSAVPPDQEHTTGEVTMPPIKERFWRAGGPLGAAKSCASPLNPCTMFSRVCCTFTEPDDWQCCPKARFCCRNTVQNGGTSYCCKSAERCAPDLGKNSCCRR